MYSVFPLLVTASDWTLVAYVVLRVTICDPEGWLHVERNERYVHSTSFCPDSIQFPLNCEIPRLTPLSSASFHLASIARTQPHLSGGRHTVE
ncbi:hypothetical protein F4860DRAFT_223914 [Xylaria cubensis]|nr:hypothetical protein F4860DRAFT_223914 [Xylaria cubensis]